MAKFAAICLLVTAGIVSSQRSGIDCSFEDGNHVSSLPSKCGYKNGWDGMTRANWKIANSYKKIRSPNNYFAYFKARNRPAGFSSRFISPVVSIYDDTCVTFSYVNKGPRTPFPKGRSSLQVYFAPNGRELRKGKDKPVWSSDSRTGNNKWARAEVALTDVSLGERLRGSVVFTAVRGGSKRAYLAIDNVSIKQCRDSQAKPLPSSTLHKFPNPVVTKTETEVSSDPLDMLRTLAAHRPIRTREFSLPPGTVYDPSDPATLPSLPELRRNGGKTRSRGHRRRKGKGKKKKKKELGVVYFTDEPRVPASQEPFVPTLIGQERPQNLCDFAQYTQGLKKCLRAFFSMLRQHRSQSKCNSDYLALEQCLQSAATKCVPNGEMTAQQVDDLISDTLRTKFKTQQVYCLEEGAFVFPEFSLGSIPLQCTREYFGKLTACGGSFAGLFHFKHGDPNLCKEYFHANECQRQTTAEECNFDARSMLIYGLNLQYQFAHNPFCIDLPFSSWWPTAQ